jgi:hypothetical protein
MAHFPWLEAGAYADRMARRFQFNLSWMLAGIGFFAIALAGLRLWPTFPVLSFIVVAVALSLAIAAVRRGRQGVTTIVGLWLLLFSVAVLAVVELALLGYFLPRS